MSEELSKKIRETYGERIRVRACGCLLIHHKLLLLKHELIGPDGYFWNVPGGEPLPGESLKEAVAREFIEETGLTVKVGSLIHIADFVKPPLHAIEFYFETFHESGIPNLGYDPEGVRILSELSLFSEAEFLELPATAKPSFIAKKIRF